MFFRGLYCVLIVLSSLFTYVVPASSPEEAPLVETSSGAVRGRLLSLPHGTAVHEFLGIRFAEPPARFAPPEPARPWKGVRDAVEYGNRCPQPPAPNDMAPPSKTPDCLFLNVFTPQTATPTSQLAVMAYIHGGGFTYSSGSEYHPGVLAAFNDVIVVTFNYRLGIFGFFNVPGTELKGNYGMLDQVLALKWIQANIASFGGDPGRVTIFGESGGGIAASLHLISPLSKGLFQRAIVQSGAASTPVYGTKPDGVQLRHFAERIGCPVEPATELAKCAREKSLEDLLGVQRSISFPESNDFQDITGPNVDGEFLPDLGENLYKAGRFNDVDVMLGVTSNEGGLTPLNLSPNASRDGLSRAVFEELVREGMVLARQGQDFVKDLVLYEYTDHSDPDDPMKIAEQVQQLNSDVVFVAPAILEAQALAKGDSPPYFYVFDHRPTFSIFPGTGAFHGADVLYVFGAPYKPLGGFYDMVAPAYTEMEKGLSSYVMKLWTNFAKYGNPSQSDDGRTLVTWPKFTPEEQSYLTIGLEPKVGHRFRAAKAAFWNQLIPKITEGTPTQHRPTEEKSGKDEL